MRFLESILIAALFPCFAYAADETHPTAKTVDTFGQLLEKQAELMNSELDAKIRAHKNQDAVKNNVVGKLPANASPLIAADQKFSEKEPLLEAIWGPVGNEVVEINYLGVPVPVSMKKPYVSEVDGWMLEEIFPYSISLIKKTGQRIVQRKVITLDWASRNPSSSVSAPSFPRINQE